MGTRVILLSDSRGVGLIQQIRAEGILPPSTIIEGREFRGATLEDLYSQLRKRTIYRNSCRTVALLLGGICDFTTKSFTHRGTEIIYQPTCSRITSLQDTISSLVRFSKRNDLNLILSTIPPACILKATDYNIKHKKLLQSSYTLQELTRQQELLERDITEINNYIVETAQKENLPHIRLVKAVLHKKKKGEKAKDPPTRFVYSKFPDGIHPNSDLKNTWVSIIAAYCLKALDLTNNTGKSVSEESCNNKRQSKEKSRDFKRRKTTD